MCDENAITTAAQIPVCKEHFLKYAKEASEYLPENERVFWTKLQHASYINKLKQLTYHEI